jgi:Clp amino terminal domain, pathogenicity island component
VFERYTEKARRVIFFARYEASELGSPYIESEHLLLGFLRESKSGSIRLLSNSSFTFDTVRERIKGHTTIRSKILTSVDLPLTDECKHILHYAAEEADRIGHKHIGTEHLLAGMLLEKNCYAARLLTEHGVSLEGVRDVITEEPTKALSEVRSLGLPAGYRWKNLLYNHASENIIIELTRADTGHLPMSRLFTRHKDAADYEQIGKPADDVSYESAVTCEKHPVIIFNIMKWEGGCGNPDGVYAFNLNTRDLNICIAKDALSTPEPQLRSWVLALVSLSDDAQTLYLKIGVQPLSKGGAVDYFLASLELADKKLQLLSRLRDIRF